MTIAGQPLGTVEREGEVWKLRFERRFTHAPDKVWRALTESEHLAHWMPVDIVGERRAGASIELPFWAPMVAKYSIEVPTTSGQIRVWDPPKVFEWTWDTDLLRWELEPVGGGTLLRLITWVASGPGPAETAAGYHVCLDHLLALVEAGGGPPLVDADPSTWEVRYAEVVAEVS